MHDSNQFEVKLDYRIDPNRDLSRYRVETYFFIPKSLGITYYTYPREQFYADIQAYIRFKTPTVSLLSLIDPKNDQSPFRRLQELMPNLLRDPQQADIAERISYELRLLGCLIRANVRDRVLVMCELLRDSTLQATATRQQLLHDTDTQSRTLLAEIHEVSAALRDLRGTFSEPVLPVALREVYQYVDEYLSLTLEYHLTLLLDHMDRAPEARREPLPARDVLAQAIVQEQEGRRSTGYPQSYVSPEGNESFLYRRGLLKKFVMSVLFLEISKEKESRAADLFAAIAAGIAALFFTAAAIATQVWYALNSLPFILIAAVSYILKDRIKDWTKSYFASKLTRWLWDYNVRIEDPINGVTIGRCREAFCFMAPEQVSPDVLRRRHESATSAIELDLKRESIIRYEKDIHLLGKTIDGLHGRLHEINDIIRFNINSFLPRTDDPVRTIRWFDAEHNRVDNVECPKVYHLNIIFVLRAHSAKQAKRPPQIERVRVVLDKNGIRRLETL